MKERQGLGFFLGTSHVNSQSWSVLDFGVFVVVNHTFGGGGSRDVLFSHLRSVCAIEIRPGCGDGLSRQLFQISSGQGHERLAMCLRDGQIILSTAST